MVSIVLIVTIFLAFVATSGYIFYHYKKREKINRILSLLKDEKVSILKDTPTQDRDGKINLEWKLIRAGMSRSDFFMTMVLIYVVFVVLVAAAFFYLDSMKAYLVLVSFVVLSFFMPNIYLDSVHQERVKKIEHDLSTFLDLVIIILESGGGMKNALKDVTLKGEKILSKELTKEIKQLEAEMTTYSAQEAYENLSKRTGSKHIGALVEFLNLADETGIGVKTIFESQSKDIKAEEFFAIEKKAATVNLTLTMIIFVFIVPALGAFIVLPMMNDSSMMGGI